MSILSGSLMLIFLGSLLQGRASSFSFVSDRCGRHRSSATALFSTERMLGTFIDSYSPASATYSVSKTYSPDEALNILDTTLLPMKEYGARIGYGRDAQGIDSAEVVEGNDPRLTLTYGEFPTNSMDQLLDRALRYHTEDNNNNNNNNRQREQGETINMVDLGSGCGRLVLYAALTRESWKISGIEISDILHSVAMEATQRGVQSNLFQSQESETGRTSFQLHCGPAEACRHVLRQADVIFAYSTVWQTSGFSEELGAMIMDRSWSELLAKSCRKGCLVVTTDRALDPNEGWELLDRMDVENREVMGSTGFIQILR